MKMTIGEVSRKIGIASSALRYYEEVGILPPPARERGQRRYGDDVLQRLTVVKMAQDAGFSIVEIRTLFHGFPEATPASDRWHDLARRKLVDVDALIERLLVMRTVLNESLACRCLTLDSCAQLGWSGKNELT